MVTGGCEWRFEEVEELEGVATQRGVVEWKPTCELFERDIFSQACTPTFIFNFKQQKLSVDERKQFTLWFGIVSM